MNPGKLDRLITLLRPIKSRDTSGSEVINFTGAGTDWANMRPVSVRDQVAAAGQQIPVAETIWRIRYRSDIAADWRIRYDGRDYALAGPPFESFGEPRRSYLDCPTQSVPAATLVTVT